MNIRNNRAFTTKRAGQKENSYFSFANERREETRSSGFTLIETLIAVSIITLSVSGPLFTANSAIVAAENARNQLTASHLAQEGIEYVRLMRDNGYLSAYQSNPATASSVAWADFISGGSAASITQCRASACTLDPTRTMGYGSGFSLVGCSGSSCAPLHLSNAIYTVQQIGTETPFTRTVQAFDVSATDERIVSTVSWSYHNTPYSVTISNHLTPWQ